MRRGLMGRSAEELPQEMLAARLRRLQDAIVRDKFDALLIYTNLIRPAAVSWLTGFTPYWIDSILLVRPDGAPVLATALSKRVADWIRSTSWLDEIVNTPKPGTAIGQRLASAGAMRVGVVELDAFPAGFYDELSAAAPSAAFINATPTFAGARASIDPAERGLIARADAIARAALAQVDAATADNAGALAGMVEQHARLAAAEEAYIAVAPDLAADRRLVRLSRPEPLADIFAVRASIAYKGSWVRRTRTFAKGSATNEMTSAIANADAWLDEVARSFVPGNPFGVQLADQVKALPRAELKGFMVESCIGSYPLEVVARPNSPAAESPPAPGSFAVLSVELSLHGVPWLGAAPGFVEGS